MEKNKELKELLSLVLSTANAINAAGKDGTINMADLGLLIALVPKVGPAFDNVKEIPAELSAMSPEDAADLALFVTTQLVIDNEKAKVIIDKSFQTLISIFALVKAIKG